MRVNQHRDGLPEGARVRSLRDLPREIAPSRDLWPEIAAQVEGRAGAGIGTDRGARWSWAMAAGVAALAIGILLGRLTLPNAGSGSLSAATGARAAAAGFVDAAYVAERARLRRSVVAQIQALPAAQRSKLLSSVQALQRAVDDIQAALGKDPGNALLQELLVNACQDEMSNLSDINSAAGAVMPARAQETTL